jgi:hypothetical protein
LKQYNEILLKFLEELILHHFKRLAVHKLAQFIKVPFVLLQLFEPLLVRVELLLDLIQLIEKYLVLLSELMVEFLSNI